MKEKVLTVVIGVLIGAVLTTAGFLIYINMNQKNTQPVMNREFMHQMQNGNGQFSNKPENIPNNENENNMQNPPEMLNETKGDTSQENTKANKQQEKGNKTTKNKTKTSTENNNNNNNTDA